MEAVARFDFQAESNSELPLNRGDVIKVLDTSDSQWFKAENGTRKGYVPSNYIELKPCDWFYGKISRMDAESQLAERGAVGDFLVRDSESDPGTFSISVRYGPGGAGGAGVQHFKVMSDKTGEYRVWEQPYASLNQLVDAYRAVPISRGIAGLCLLRALPRPQPAVAVAGRLRRFRALYDFEALEEGELAFRKDDIVELLEEVEENWYRGLCNGRVGIFPHTYCQEILS